MMTIPDTPETKTSKYHEELKKNKLTWEGIEPGTNRSQVQSLTQYETFREKSEKLAPRVRNPLYSTIDM